MKSVSLNRSTHYIIYGVFDFMNQERVLPNQNKKILICYIILKLKYTGKLLCIKK